MFHFNLGFKTRHSCNPEMTKLPNQSQIYHLVQTFLFYSIIVKYLILSSYLKSTRIYEKMSDADKFLF